GATGGPAPAAPPPSASADVKPAAAAPSAASTASDSATPSVSVNDLPNAEEAPAHGASRGGAAHARATKAAPGVTAAPAAAPATTNKAPRTVSTQWVPSVKNPGF
ncbi:MAG TPA: hypothetical protein VHB21_10055, partial [Minicystis sp.]|nr:hypothetical protein [Minicystis sp.]